ncbi:hypothetical protein OJAV_G00054550 [Oryzias javanicus]|uniref:Alpha-endosulfine n=1 Tax=Oryzias javanicus TaxID=123683 RepID=A0A3S2PWJ9_ORYJA|nr:hypothetical protein OJAV_G00054550 [Oryzias javanicus]
MRLWYRLSVLSGEEGLRCVTVTGCLPPSLLPPTVHILQKSLKRTHGWHLCLSAHSEAFRATMSEENEETKASDEQQEMEETVVPPEKAEEAKLKARYPNLGAKPGGSDFLMKRLQKGGQKYFDSGDYNMAKAKMKNKQLPSAPAEKAEVTGGHIPTPQDLPHRKTSMVTSKLAG